uniref:Uncharacterized protein n=2 Tax=Parascaris univalens TaxID=6257 RepID=A0A915BVA2_PARUN
SSSQHSRVIVELLKRRKMRFARFTCVLLAIFVTVSFGFDKKDVAKKAISLKKSQSTQTMKRFGRALASNSIDEHNMPEYLPSVFLPLHDLYYSNIARNGDVKSRKNHGNRLSGNF